MSQEVIITNYIEIHERIRKLNYLKAEHELVIKRNLQEIIYSIHPSVIFKKFISKVSQDNEASRGLKSISLNLGKDFLINKLFGNSGSLKGFVSSLLMRKVSDYIIINHSEFIAKSINMLDGFLIEKNKISK